MTRTVMSERKPPPEFFAIFDSVANEETGCQARIIRRDAIASVELRSPDPSVGNYVGGNVEEAHLHFSRRFHRIVIRTIDGREHIAYTGHPDEEDGPMGRCHDDGFIDASLHFNRLERALYGGQALCLGDEFGTFYDDEWERKANVTDT
jgi:hypothetical protein